MPIHRYCIMINVMFYMYSQIHQVQAGSADCGLFALAFAAILASGKHPSAYQFQQKLMRQHLVSCLTAMKFQQFPVQTISRENRHLARFTHVIHLYCYCRMPKLFSTQMIQCSKCRSWYHLEVCVSGVDTAKPDWFCQNCK